MSRRRVPSFADAARMEQGDDGLEAVELSRLERADKDRDKDRGDEEAHEEDTDRLLGAFKHPAGETFFPALSTVTPRESCPRSLPELKRAVLAWARGRKTWRSLVAFLVVLFVYYELTLLARTPRQLHNFEGAPRYCAYLDAAAIEQRRAKLPASLQKVPLRVGIVTFFGNLDPTMREASIQNKRDYAGRHGYEIIIADDQIDKSRPAAWSKFPILQKYLPDYDYLMWSDADAIFMNMTIRVEDLIDGEHELFFARDESDINSGVFLIRNSEWSKWWLKEAWDQEWLITGNHPFKYEQRAIHYLFGTKLLEEDAAAHGRGSHPKVDEIRAKTLVVPYCAFNSNICENFFFSLTMIRRFNIPGFWCDNIYENGDFIMHFAGVAPPMFYRDWLFLDFIEDAEKKNAISN